MSTHNDDHLLNLQDELLQQGNDVYTGDGTVDLNGRPVLRSKTGNWNACRFILGTEWCERLAFSGIESNLMTYLTRQMHLGNASAARIATTWSGTCYLTPLLGAFIADTYWGRYRTISVFSIIYIIGLCALTLSVFLPVKNVVFFAGLYIIAVGTGGITPCVSSFGADQFDDTDSRERAIKGSFFNWYFLCITGGSLVASSLFVWIQENVGWGVGYGIPALCMAVAAACFFCGTRIYRVQRLAGSPFLGICHVIVAAVRKCEVDSATTQQAEELKIVIRLLSILVTGIIDLGAQAQKSTTFVEQGMTMNRRVGNFTIPAASLATCATLGSLVWVLIHEKAFIPLVRKFTCKERGISELQRIGIGYFLTILSMVCAMLVETRRLQLAEEQLDPNDDGLVALSVLWQVPQYVMLGISQVSTVVGRLEFVYNQSPDSMKSLCAAFALLIISFGSYLSSFVLTIVTVITTAGGSIGWIPDNLNKGHLDYYFGFWAAFTFFNFLVYVLCAMKYKPKMPKNLG